MNLLWSKWIKYYIISECRCCILRSWLNHAFKKKKVLKFLEFRIRNPDPDYIISGFFKFFESFYDMDHSYLNTFLRYTIQPISERLVQKCSVPWELYDWEVFWSNSLDWLSFTVCKSQTTYNVAKDLNIFLWYSNSPPSFKVKIDFLAGIFRVIWVYGTSRKNWVSRPH